MKKAIVGVALALSVVTSNASADGIDTRPYSGIAAPAPYVAPPNWSGFYLGAGIGGGAVVHDISIRDDVFGSILNFDGIGGEGVFGTAIVGWDWQVGPTTVLGVLADYDFSDISTDFSAFGGALRANIDHEHSWSVGARLGLLSSPSALWYVTGGYTEARFDASASATGVGRISRDRTFNGYFVGAGIDTRLALSNWFLRLEYRFSDFDSDRVFQTTVGGDTVRVNVDPDMHTARLSLTYKFNGGFGGWGYGNWATNGR